MKVLALNGSPRMKASSTYHMLTPLLDGMQAAGAETDIIHIRKLKLNACIGCYTCWANTPGECVHKDNMTDALQKFNTADLVIFGTPVYHFTMTGIMKDFIDRTLPRLEPWLIPHPHVPGVTGHPERVNKPGKIMVVSACGFPEYDNFDPLLVTFKHMARMAGWEYVGDILRTGAEPLSSSDLQGLFTDYYDLVRQAGEQIIRDGHIREELQVELRKDLFPGGKEAFYDMAGAYWEQRMDRHKVPQELRHTVPVSAEEITANQDAGLTPAVESISREEADEPEISGEKTIDKSQLNCYQIISGMPTVFDADVAGNLTADIQFDVSGKEPGIYYLRIEDGNCSFHEDQSPSPQLIIRTPSEVWQAVSCGDIDGLAAFMQQKYTVEGDFNLLMKLNDLFKTG